MIFKFYRRVAPYYTIIHDPARTWLCLDFSFSVTHIF